MDFLTVLWPDLLILRRRLARYLLTTLISPLLYLLAFGWGLGRGVNMGGTSYLEFVIPGIMAAAAMTASFNGAGTKLNVDRLFYKCFDELMMAPLSPWSIVLGKALIGVVRGLVTAAAFWLVAYLISSGFTPGIWFLMVIILSCFLFAFLGVLAAFLARSHEDMATFSTLFLLPMTFLGGTFFSLAGVPRGVRFVLYLLPLSHVTSTLRALALGWPFPWPSLAVMVALTVAFSLACLAAVRRSSV